MSKIYCVTCRRLPTGSLSLILIGGWDASWLGRDSTIPSAWDSAINHAAHRRLSYHS